jgi:hypothetical protein
MIRQKKNDRDKPGVSANDAGGERKEHFGLSRHEIGR